MQLKPCSSRGFLLHTTPNPVHHPRVHKPKWTIKRTFNLSPMFCLLFGVQPATHTHNNNTHLLRLIDRLLCHCTTASMCARNIITALCTLFHQLHEVNCFFSLLLRFENENIKPYRARPIYILLSIHHLADLLFNNFFFFRFQVKTNSKAIFDLFRMSCRCFSSSLEIEKDFYRWSNRQHLIFRQIDA